MKKRMDLRTKMIIGFLGVALITLGVGIAGIVGLSQATERLRLLSKEDIPAVLAIENTLVSVEKIKLVLRTLTSPYLSDDDYNRQFENLKKARESYQKYLDFYDKLPKTNEEKIMYQDFINKITYARELNNKYFAEVSNLRANKTDPATYNRIASSTAISGEIRKGFDDVTDSLEKLVNYEQDYYTVKLPNQALAMFDIMIKTIIIVVIVAFIAAIAIGLLLAQATTKPILKILNNLSAGSKEIASASEQLAYAADSISNGAAEQASQIEETTASMEELASMVRQNVDNSQASASLSLKATEMVESTSNGVAEMLMIMEEINNSSDEIANILDVIDEIAFQTNMLALNAAVEAARAGEAGMGFAVVADEVKSLANRSGDNSKEIAKIIKDSIKRTENGLATAKSISEQFKEIINGAKKATEMTKEIELASKQQDQGIQEVNKAIIQFDIVVQSNVASSEETASAAEELKAQVGSLDDIVNNLLIIITGQGRTHDSSIDRDDYTPKTKSVKKSEPKKLTHNNQSKEDNTKSGVKKLTFETDDEFINI